MMLLLSYVYVLLNFKGYDFFISFLWICFTSFQYICFFFYFSKDMFSLLSYGYVLLNVMDMFWLLFHAYVLLVAKGYVLLVS